MRSVNDYETNQELLHALSYAQISLVDGEVVYNTHQQPVLDDTTTTTTKALLHVPVSQPLLLLPPKNADWVLDNFDPETTKEQTVQDEYERLRVLQSYMILDVDSEEVFEGFTATASHEFNVPIALVSLVDLGRQWFMSNHGLPADCKETPRCEAFCAHAIQSKNPSKVFLVPDTTQDDRFAHNNLVIGFPHIRFYAGASLISPEGYSLGTFCIIDTKSHPEGLSDEQQESLQQYASKTVKRMVDRRRRLEKGGLTKRRLRVSNRDNVPSTCSA